MIVHLLPELSKAQRHVAEEAAGLLPFLEDHVYLFALAGLAVFYGVERASRRSRARRREKAGEDRTEPWAFWLSLGSFALYNAIVGYLLVHREEPGFRSLAFFTVALAVHFVVNDFGLREHHKHAYRSLGRWLLAATGLLGWLVGALRRFAPFALGAAAYAAVLQAV